jgi:hypothetical protein
MSKLISKSFLAYFIFLGVMLGQFEMHFSQTLTPSETFSINELIGSIVSQNGETDGALVEKADHKAHRLPLQHESTFSELEEETEEIQLLKKKLLNGFAVTSYQASQYTYAQLDEHLSSAPALLSSSEQDRYLILEVFRL